MRFVLFTISLVNLDKEHAQNIIQVCWGLTLYFFSLSVYGFQVMMKTNVTYNVTGAIYLLCGFSVTEHLPFNYLSIRTNH